jgi:hypothetical protein
MSDEPNTRRRLPCSELGGIVIPSRAAIGESARLTAGRQNDVPSPGLCATWEDAETVHTKTIALLCATLSLAASYRSSHAVTSR